MLSRGPSARLGTVLAGKWTLEALLGVGGAGAVYRARHRNGSHVAIKVLHAWLAGDRRFAARLERESRLANRVGHPAVARVLDDGVTEDGCPFLVSELVEGETLEAIRVAQGGSMPWNDVLRVGDELLAVLEAAHAAGVLHRDLKPANVMRLPSGELKVLDFGLGVEVERARDGTTTDGAMLGTIGFMAPEQAQGRWDLVDATTDLWAVAATLFKLGTGLDAHEGDTPQTRAAYAATRPVVSVGARSSHVPAVVAGVLDRALAFSKQDRFPDARAFREALRAAALEASAQMEPLSRAPARRTSFFRRRSVTLAVAVVAPLALALAIAAVRAGRSGSGPADPRIGAMSSGGRPTGPSAPASSSAGAGAPETASPPPPERPRVSAPPAAHSASSAAARPIRSVPPEAPTASSTANAVDPLDRRR